MLSSLPRLRFSSHLGEFAAITFGKDEVLPRANGPIVLSGTVTANGGLLSAVPCRSSFELVVNAFASRGLLGNLGFLSLFLSLIVLPLSSSLGGGEDSTGSQTMSASFTTNFTNSEKGGKTSFCEGVGMRSLC